MGVLIDSVTEYREKGFQGSMDVYGVRGWHAERVLGGNLSEQALFLLFRDLLLERTLIAMMSGRKEHNMYEWYVVGGPNIIQSRSRQIYQYAVNFGVTNKLSMCAIDLKEAKNMYDIYFNSSSSTRQYLRIIPIAPVDFRGRTLSLTNACSIVERYAHEREMAVNE